MFQNITIVGRLGRDPEMRYTPAGNPVTNFSVATDRKYTKGDEKVTETVWFNAEAWGKLAEICNQYLHKGNQVFITGRVKEPRPWMGDDGKPRCQIEVVVETIKFLSAKPNGETEAAPEAVAEEIPF